MTRSLVILLFSASSLLAETPTQRVGQPLEIREIYIPGGEVKPKPRRDRKPPLTVRVLETRPAKDGFRYDFEVQGFEPGIHNLADYLDAPEGTTLQAISLEITSRLAPGLQNPHPVEPKSPPKLGGYKQMMILLGTVWVAGLLAILLWRKKKAGTTELPAARATLAERLRPILENASKGTLSSDERARLERLLIGHWRERLPEIAALAPAEAMATLRTHPEASPLILALERWLHARDATLSDEEMERLLVPYQNSGK